MWRPVGIHAEALCVSGELGTRLRRPSCSLPHTFNGQGRHVILQHGQPLDTEDGVEADTLGACRESGGAMDGILDEPGLRVARGKDGGGEH